MLICSDTDLGSPIRILPVFRVVFTGKLWLEESASLKRHLISPTPRHNPSHLVPCGISMAGARILQLRDTMSLIEADLGSVCGRVRSYFGITRPPQQNRSLSPLHEPLHWKAKRDPKAKMLSLCSPFYVRACRWAMFGEIVT